MLYDCLKFLIQIDNRVLVNVNIRGVIKKFVDWCSEINTFIAMLTGFVGNIKQQMFYQLWKFMLDTLIINHFIIKYILYGMVTRRSLRRVPWRSTTLLFSHVTLYILIHTGVKYQLFYMNIKFDKLLSESQHNTLKVFSFFYIRTTARNNVA